MLGVGGGSAGFNKPSVDADCFAVTQAWTMVGGGGGGGGGGGAGGGSLSEKGQRFAQGWLG